MTDFKNMIDHTLLKPDSTREQIKMLVDEAKKYEFCSVCINPKHVSYASELLNDSNVKVCTVIGFPLGANSSKVKAFEAQISIEDGANEVDMVIDIGAAKEHDWARVENDIAEVRKVVPNNVMLKVIIETCLLNDEEKEKVCRICSDLGVDFVKTSTGFSTGGATVDDVKLMKASISEKVKVKASGGVKTKEDAEKMVNAGADRLGTSNGVAIVC